MNDNWQEWMDRLEAGDLSPAELLEFEQWLRSHPSKRDEYLQELMTSVSIESAELPNPWSGQQANPSRWSPRFYRNLGIAAGIVALVGISYLCGAIAGIMRPGQEEVVSDVFATVTDANDAVADPRLRIGQFLGNRRIELPEGAELGIAMRGGARLELNGPVEMSIEGPEQVKLIKGRIRAYAPEYARGFVVDTTDGRVVDLGTRFVTAAGTGNGTEVHVLEGLVEAYSNADSSNQSLGQERAAVLRNGRIESTEFLAQRLQVPLDPVLKDADGDGFADTIEKYYLTDPADADSKPRALRIVESFVSHNPGPLVDISPITNSNGDSVTWHGAGSFQADGLTYPKGGTSLLSSPGSFQTMGENSVGASFYPASMELPTEGVTYISFLMKNPAEEFPGCFAGLLLYQNDREELFVGKIGTENSYGSRFKQGDIHDAFRIGMDDRTHLFVVRIDRTRLITDVFYDPDPGMSEKEATFQIRYQAVPEVDRVEVRSGCPGRIFQSQFDEIRMGLTWDSVMPLE